MRSFQRVFYSRRSWLAFSITALMLFACVSLSTDTVLANHPVLVEGNCDSPVPGTTLVSPGTCGDFDGDGRIGTAEDTDGADRIFGTLRAALGPGTGAAAGTGANFNGTITIVTSGRFAETLFIGNSGIDVGEGTANPGNVTIEAAPGVEAQIDAVLQGDPAGGNGTRQDATGIKIAYTNNDRRVVLRNLTIRNFTTAVFITLNSRVTIDSCRFENNRFQSMLLVDNAQVGVFNSKFFAAGYRLGAGVDNSASLSSGIFFSGTSSGTVSHSHFTGHRGPAIRNAGGGVVTYYEVFLGNNGLGIIGATRDNTP
jgi:hypothetical protein